LRLRLRLRLRLVGGGRWEAGGGWRAVGAGRWAAGGGRLAAGGGRLADLLRDADAIGVVPVVAHVAAHHEGSVLDAAAHAALEAVRLVGVRLRGRR
jgi:hypothetical protein